jgi:hypothetical protein
MLAQVGPEGHSNHSDPSLLGPFIAGHSAGSRKANA